MGVVDLPNVTLGNDDKENVKKLYDAYFQLREEMEFLLNNLDERNVIRAGSVYAENIDTRNAKIGTAQIDDLYIGNGGNVTLGEGAVISWDKVNKTGATATDVNAISSTYIDQYNVFTANVYAQNIRGSNISTQNWDGTGDYLSMNRQNIFFYQDGTPDIVKMAIGFLPNKDNVNIPLLVLGAGDGFGNNRGYIQKDTDGLSMYYVGSLSGGEVSYLKLTKDKASLNGYDIFSKRDSISDSYISSASNWNTTINKTAKLNSDGTKYNGKFSSDTNDNLYLRCPSTSGYAGYYAEGKLTGWTVDTPLHSIISNEISGGRIKTEFSFHTIDNGLLKGLEFKSLDAGSVTAYPYWDWNCTNAYFSNLKDGSGYAYATQNWVQNSAYVYARFK